MPISAILGQNTNKRLAGDEGIEPSSAELEAAMLPLHQSPVAHPEGFEPSTSEVEARCSSPLSYGRLWRPVRDSNSRLPRSKRGFLSAELTGREDYVLRRRLRRMVCVAGIEPATSCSQGRRATAALHAEVVGRGSVVVICLDAGTRSELHGLRVLPRSTAPLGMVTTPSSSGLRAFYFGKVQKYIGSNAAPQPSTATPSSELSSELSQESLGQGDAAAAAPQEVIPSKSNDR